MKDLMTERERKLKWYHDNKEKVNLARKEKRNEKRRKKGLPSMEEYYALRDKREKLLNIAVKFIKAREAGDPDPGISSPDLEEVIREIMEKRKKKREYNKAYWKKYKVYLEERDRLILKMREEDKEISSIPSITEMNIFEDDE